MKVMAADPPPYMSVPWYTLRRCDPGSFDEGNAWLQRLIAYPALLPAQACHTGIDGLHQRRVQEGSAQRVILDRSGHALDGGFSLVIEGSSLPFLAGAFVPLSEVIGNRVEERWAVQLFGQREGALQFCSRRLGVSELAGDLATPGPAERHVLLRGGCLGFFDALFDIAQGLVIGAGGIRQLCKPDEEPDLPPPAVSARRFTDDPVERWGKIGQGARWLTQRQVVQTEVDQGADLHNGNAMGAPEICTLVIQLGGTGGSAQLTVKPPQVVLHAAQKEHVLPLLRLGQDLVRDAERLLIVPPTPLGQTEKRQTVQLIKAIMDVTGNAQTLLGEVDGWLKLPLPVGFYC